MKRKVVAATLVAGMVAASLGGVVQAEESVDITELKLAFIVGTMNDAFYQSVAEGIEAQCEEYGITDITVSDQQLDGSICTDLINTYVAGEYDAVALSCNDPAGTVPAIEQAINAGTQIFTFDCTLDDEYIDDYISFVGTDNYTGGVLAAEYILENAPEGSTVGCITYASAQSTQDRQAGFEETIQAAIDEGRDLTLIESQDADNDQAKAADIMQNLVTQYGDELSYIFVVGDPTGYGALSSIQAAGASTKIVGFDAGETALEYIADETVGQIWVAEVAQDPVGIGSGIVDQIVEYYTNGEVETQKNLLSPSVVTAENVADYME
ncbi:MAG: substrate-binding domain-containing protein [Lachnospiraceae bacterium]|nr:substrate-binding domain-containing protein [Lachnospiraceae bacterium]